MFNSVNLAILSVAWAHGWLSGVILVLFAWRREATRSTLPNLSRQLNKAR